jgi:hypothetical protein
MATAAEYRNWAEDYFKLARDAPDANVRVAYVKMAQLWLECAYQIEFTRASTFRQKL